MKATLLSVTTLASAAAATQRPKETGYLPHVVGIAPVPTAVAIHRRDADYACASSVGTELQIVSSVSPALSSYAAEHPELPPLGDTCTLTVPLNLTSAVKDFWSAEKTWASTVSSKAAAIHTDCGAGAPITLPLSYLCPDGMGLVGTAAGKEPQSTSYPGITGPSEVVVGSSASKDVSSSLTLGAVALIAATALIF